jgi:hypothetical protein
MRVTRRGPFVGDCASMPVDDLFSDTILFELPRERAAAHLCQRLQSRWTEWLEEDNGRWIVFAQLRPDSGDLAMLLRTVEAWIAECGLDELWFQLDGRTYLLRAPSGVPSTAQAA